MIRVGVGAVKNIKNAIIQIKSIVFENLVTFFKKQATTLIIVAFILLCACLLFYKINSLMSFLGDQGFFYLSARDLLVYHHFPLVGINATHAWLHQGPIWTYMLAIMLFLFNFNPLSGVYLTIFLTLIDSYLIYKTGELYFSKKVGIISTILYSTSNLIIINGRLPYHTSPTAFFMLLFLISLYKFIKGKIYHLPLSIFFIAILYNLEISNLSLLFMLLLIIFFGFYRKFDWALNLKNKKIILLSILAFLIPMLPIEIYDVTHGFPQSFKFLEWIIYHILQMFGLFKNNLVTSQTSWNQVLFLIIDTYRLLIFPLNIFIPGFLFILTLIFFYRSLFIELKLKKYNLGFILLGLIFGVGILSYLFAKTAESAYLLILTPVLILMTAYVLNKLFNKFNIALILILMLITALNIFSLFKFNFYSGIKFSDRINVSKKIVRTSNGRKYNLLYLGAINGYASSTMNYQYLTWYYANEPVNRSEKLKFTIIENSNNTISLKEN